MNYAEILTALRDFTCRDRVDLLSLASDPAPISPYQPIVKYVLDLKNGAKPETAAEDLFVALCKDVLGFHPTRQVGVAEGYVDFMLPERIGEPMQLELKPLFHRDAPDTLWRSDANPKHHAAQVKKYLRDHEYLVLSDLRTAWFSAPGTFISRTRPSRRSHSAISWPSAAKPGVCSTPCAASRIPPRNRNWSSSSSKTLKSGSASSIKSGGRRPSKRPSPLFSSSTS